MRSADAEIGESTPLVPKKYDSSTSFERVILHKVHNRVFASNVDLAIRSAVVLLLVALPSMNHRYDPFGAPKHFRINPHGIAMLNFVFSFYPTVGETVAAAFASFLGTFLAACGIWMLMIMKPGGITATSSVLEICMGSIGGSSFVVGVLLLNCNMNTKIFALVYFTFYWMTFLSPRHSYDPYRLTVVVLTLAGYGCILAIVTSLLPYPRMALHKAREAAQDAGASLGKAWEDATDFCCSSTQQAYDLDRLLKDMKDLQDLCASLKKHTENSRMECFGIGRSQAVRLMLHRVGASLKKNSESFRALLICCSSTKRRINHHPFILTLTNDLHGVRQRSADLMSRLIQFACDGYMNECEKESIKQDATTLSSDVQILTKKFHALKQKTNRYGVDELSLQEHVCCYSICAAAGNACELADDMVAGSSGLQECSPDQVWHMWEFANMRVIAEKENLNFVFRNSLSILLAFFIGYFGFGRMVTQGDPNIANICSLMLSKFVGSAVTGNLNRIQGLTLGTVIGQIIYSTLGGCSVMYLVMLSFAVFFWVATTMFIYFHSEKYSVIGLFLAAFGTQHMLDGCSEDFTRPGDTYGKIVTSVLSMVLILSVDLTFGNRRASNTACDVLTCVYKDISADISNLLSHRDVHTSENVSLHDQILQARALGLEADEEPRYWRTPWRMKSFAAAIKSAETLRPLVRNLQSAASEGGKLGMPKQGMFLNMIQLPEFAPVLETIQAKIELIRKLCSIFLHEVPEHFDLLDQDESYKDHLGQLHERLQIFIEALNATETTVEQEVTSLEHDHDCLASLLIATIWSMVHTLRSVQHHMLQNR